MEDINHNRMEVEEALTKGVVEEDSLVYPALPQEVWLQVFRGLPEGDLARVAQVALPASFHLIIRTIFLNAYQLKYDFLHSASKI